MADFSRSFAEIRNKNFDIYRPSNPKQSDYYTCVENHFEQLQGVWDERYAPVYGFWRPIVMDVIYKYLECADLNCGFARVRCDHCGHEYLPVFVQTPAFLSVLPSEKGDRIR